MRIGIITGSGTYALPGLEAGDAREVTTPFGTTTVTEGRLAGVDVLHVSRHGEGHRRVSHQVDHRTNVLALRDAGADGILGVTVCGATDTSVELGQLIVFDDLLFLQNRLPSGEICSIHAEPGAPGRGHWIFDDPFSPPLRAALLAGAREAGHPVRDGGTYGHVDGPRFNTKAEIRVMVAGGATAVSQTAGPETVLAGEAKVPYALLGYATDYANGVNPEDPTPVSKLVELIEASTTTFATTLAAALPAIEAAPPVNGTHFEWS